MLLQFYTEQFKACFLDPVSRLSEEQKDSTMTVIQKDAQELLCRQEFLEPQSKGNSMTRKTSVMSLLPEAMKSLAESAALITADGETMNTIKDFQTIYNATTIS